MIVGIIPARIGSKRLTKKNIRSVCNKPMIQWTIDASLNSKYLTKENLIVSTESEEIKDTVKDMCLVHDRPELLSRDDVWIQPVIDNAIQNLNLKEEDIIVILQPNSPQITSDIIDECIEKVIQENIWQVSTVDENFVNNGHIHVLRKKVCEHKGKANYNGFVMVDWIDVHTLEDMQKAENKMMEKNNENSID